jgi:predicted acylesterase/phospholipase RssA
MWPLMSPFSHAGHHSTITAQPFYVPVDKKPMATKFPGSAPSLAHNLIPIYMANNTVPAQPFNRIAVSCSGGGYRAASFHLGSLSYLNKLMFRGIPLLDHVQMISTVSGGTITGIVYALRKQNGLTFDSTFDFLLNQLRKTDLVKKGIEKLNPDACWKNAEKHKNLINAFAELYDECFTMGATLGELNKNEGLQVVFNSTEFNNAVDFRFRNKAAGFTGNYYFRVPPQAAEEIKLSDIMAASSCFPGGFEPILWPNDFVHGSSPVLRELRDRGQPPTGLMDGGIYDNQGIEPILNYRKGADTPFFDLVIISDVASPLMSPYAPVSEEPKMGYYKWTFGQVKSKIRQYTRLISTLLILLTIVLAALPLCWGYSDRTATGLCTAWFAGCLALLILQQFALKKLKAVRAKISELTKKVIPAYYRERLSHFKIDEMSIHRAEPLILDRINSLVTLLTNVFLKIVRRLNYKFLFGNEDYTYRRIANLIRELVEDRPNTPDRMDVIGAGAKDPGAGPYPIVSSPAIRAVAKKAAAFGTTLWFTEDEQLNDMMSDLVATGQFTMCYNLLTYLERVINEPASGFGQLDSTTRRDLQDTYTACQRDWEAFKQNPHLMAGRPA